MPPTFGKPPMSLLRTALLPLALGSLLGCGDAKTVIPTNDLTEEQKQAIRAEDAKVADEESDGRNKKRK
jgi:hypothetical protein